MQHSPTGTFNTLDRVAAPTMNEVVMKKSRDASLFTRALGLAVVGSVLMAAVPLDVNAQYFGRN